MLIAGDVRVPRVTVRYDLVAPGARLTIDTTPRAASTVTQDNDRLVIKFDADALDIDNPPLASPGQQSPQSLVRNVRQLDATTLGVDLGPRVAGFRATTLPVDTTMRLAIDVMATATEAAPAPAAAAPAPVARPSVRRSRRRPRPFRRLRSIRAMAGWTRGSKAWAGRKRKT